MWLYLIVNTQKGVLTCMLTIDLASHLSTQRSRGRICFRAHSMIGQPIGGASQGDNRQVIAPCVVPHTGITKYMNHKILPPAPAYL